MPDSIVSAGIRISKGAAGRGYGQHIRTMPFPLPVSEHIVEKNPAITHMPPFVIKRGPQKHRERRPFF